MSGEGGKERQKSLLEQESSATLHMHLPPSLP